MGLGFLRNPAFFCKNLRFPAVFCDNVRLQDAVIPGNQRKSVRDYEFGSVCPIYFVPFDPLEVLDGGNSALVIGF